jgi:hypothetical protein
MQSASSPVVCSMYVLLSTTLSLNPMTATDHIIDSGHIEQTI